jgi:hypothetical protein
VYPYPSVDEVIPLMADGIILPYLDIPFQHASPRILKLMKRPGAVEKTLDRIQSWRAAVPDLTLRSTFIVGFPGETEAEFEELLAFLKEAQLDRVGCFKYSPVEGAAANELPDAVPEELKEERLERFMAVQADISAARLATKIGREIEVIGDEADEVGTLARSPRRCAGNRRRGLSGRRIRSAAGTAPQGPGRGGRRARSVGDAGLNPPRGQTQDDIEISWRGRRQNFQASRGCRCKALPLTGSITCRPCGPILRSASRSGTNQSCSSSRNASRQP